MTASTGTLIAAALETVGYRAQAEILSQLGGMLLEGAALVYLLAALGAVVSIAVFGGYTQAKWLIVGPGLFYFLVFTPINSSGADWQFGNDAFERADGKTNADDVRAMVGGDKQVVVSWVFDRYNQLVSSLSRSLVSVITNKQSVLKEIKFTTRQKMLDEIYSSKIEDGRLVGLISIGLKGECSEAMGALRELVRGNRDPLYAQGSAAYADAARRVKELFIEKQFTLPNNSPEKQYLLETLRALKSVGNVGGAQIYRDYLDQYCETKSTPDFAYLYDDFDVAPVKSDSGMYANISAFFDGVLGNEASPIGSGSFSPELLVDRGINCQRLWCWTMIGLDLEAQEIIKKTESAHISPRADDDLRELIWKEASDKFRDPFSKMSARENLSVVVQVIQGIMVRKQFSSDSKSQIVSTFAENSGYVTDQYTVSDENWRENIVDLSRRRNQAVQATAQRAEIFQLGMSLPYIQGIMLYALALLYPFFCVMVLVPGKTSSILTWMTLWMWVKSWDLGWALVMVVDDAIWKLFPHHSYVDITRDSINAPLTVMETAFQPDPAFSLAAYYMLLGTMVIGVPMYTGQLVLGAKKALLGTILNGVKTLSGHLGTFMGIRVASSHAEQSEHMREVDSGNALVDSNRSKNSMHPELRAEYEKAEQSVGALNTAGRAIGGTLMAAGAAVNAAGNYISPSNSNVGNAAMQGGMLQSALNLPANVGRSVVGATVSGIGSTVLSLGESMYRPAIEQAQDAEKYKAQVSFMNSNYQYYNAFRSERLTFIESLRSADSSRGEYFGLPAPNMKLYADFRKAQTVFDTKTEARGWRAATGVVVGGLAIAGESVLRPVRAVGSAGRNALRRLF